MPGQGRSLLRYSPQNPPAAWGTEPLRCSREPLCPGGLLPRFREFRLPLEPRSTTGRGRSLEPHLGPPRSSLSLRAPMKTMMTMESLACPRKLVTSALV